MFLLLEIITLRCRKYDSMLMPMGDYYQFCDLCDWIRYGIYKKKSSHLYHELKQDYCNFAPETEYIPIWQVIRFN